MNTRDSHRAGWALLLVALLWILAPAASPAQTADAPPADEPQHEHESEAQEGHDHGSHHDRAMALGAEHPTPETAEDDGRKAPPVRQVLNRESVVVEFTADPAPGRSMSDDEIHAGDYVHVAFKILDAQTRQPLQGQFPGAWMDLSESWVGAQALNTTCKDRVGLYLQGLVGVRPLIDLNSYFVLVMNRDPSISVIDPITGITGITKLYAQVNLKAPGADWTKTADEKRFFVTQPKIGEVAVVNTDTFKTERHVAAGVNPTRIGMQPDGQYLWVGNDTDEPEASGVTVLDADSLELAAMIPTGAGHHELAFSADSRWAYVTNRKSGTVSVIDVRTLEKVADVPVGPLPISLAFSTSSRALYVADGEEGTITVIAGGDHQVMARIDTDPGLGPLRFSQDGRWGVAVNTAEDEAYVVDAATNQLVHTFPVGDQPYQVAFSRSFAYVRSLGTERVSMIDLSELGKPLRPPVVTFAAGQRAPAEALELSIADAIVEAPGEAAVLVVSPSDTTVYYYMEGMNAPMGNFRNYGHLPRAVQVVDRSMQELEPGIYSSTVRIPESGTYEVAFLLDSPSILHCFEIAARPNPLLEIQGPPLTVDFLGPRGRVELGEVPVRLRLADRKTGKARTDLTDVSLSYFAAPGGRRVTVPARHVGDGVYEAAVDVTSAGAWYVYVSCPSEKIEPADLPFMTLMAGVGRPGRG